MNTVQWLKRLRQRLIGLSRPASDRNLRHLRLIELEDRRVLNAAFNLVGMDLQLTSVEAAELTLTQDTFDFGSGDESAVRLELDSGTWTNLAAGPIAGTNVAGTLLHVSEAIFNSVQVQGTGATSNELRVDLSAGDFLSGLTSFSFVGGEGDPAVSADNDALLITGYSLTTADGVADVTVTHTGLESGSVTLAGLGTITFDEIEPLVLGGNAADLVINLPAGIDATVVLSDDGGANDPDATNDANMSAIDGAFEFTQFMNPTNSLTINDGTGAKTIAVQGLDAAFDADLTIVDQDATDDNAVSFQTAATGLGSGNLSVEAGTISINQAITTAGGNVRLDAETTVSSGAAGTITTTGALAGDASGTVDIDGGTNVSLLGSIDTSGAGALSNGGAVTVDSTDGDVSTASIDASAGVGGVGGNISLTAADADNTNATATGSILTSGLLSTNENAAVMLTADNAVTVNAGITGLGTGSIAIRANDDAATDSGSESLTTAAGAIIDAGAGTISLSTAGAGGGNITVGVLTTTNATATAVVLNSNGAIMDGLGTEAANVTAITGTVVLTAGGGGIGAANDLDLNTASVIFNTTGAAQITDVVDSLTISAASTAGTGATVIAANALTISADVTVGGSTTLTAGNSAAAGDSLFFTAGAVVTLNSAVSSTLTFVAGDDITFTDGRILTQGGGTHAVILTADSEGAGVADADRGGITAGLAAVEVTTNNLTADAAEGISLDVDVDTLDASVSASGDLTIVESNSLNLLDVDTADGAVAVTAAGLITATDVDSSATDNDLNDITLTSTGGGISVLRVQASANGPTAMNDVRLIASGNILDGDSGADDVDVIGHDVLLNSTAGSIGDPITVDVFKYSSDLLEVSVLNDLTAAAPGNSMAISLAAEPAGLVSLTANTAFLQSAGNINAAASALAVTNLALVTPGLITIADTGLVIDGDLRLSADNVRAVTLGSNVIVGSGAVRTNRLLYAVTTAGDELVVTYTDQIDVTTDSDIQLTLNGNTQITDLDCSFTGLDTTGNNAVLNSVAGAVTQGSNVDPPPGPPAGLNDSIRSDELLLLGTGPFRLQNSFNDVNILAANTDAMAAVSNDHILFTDSNDLTVGSVTELIGGVTHDGIATLNDDVKLDVAGTLTIAEDISLGMGDLFLLVGGNVSQQTNDTITAAGLGLMVTGTTLLTEVNDVGMFAANNGGQTLFTNAGALTVDQVTVDGMTATGLTTASADIKLTVGTAAGHNLDINQTVSSGSENLLFDVAGNVAQTAAGTITAGGLGLMVDGTTLLDQGNAVGILAADNQGITGYNNVPALSVGTVSVAGMTVTGIRTSNDDVLINADGSLAINESIDTGGPVADVRLVADGDITQSASGIILADRLGVRNQAAVGNITLNSANNVNVLAAVNPAAGGQVAFTDADSLIIDQVTAQMQGTISFAQTAAVTSSNGTIVVTAGTDLTTEPTRIVSAAGGEITLTAGRTLRILADVTSDEAAPVQDNTLIRLIGDDVFLGFDDRVNAQHAITIRTDDAAGTPDATSSPVAEGIRITADDPATGTANDGTVTFGTSVEVRTDGGVALRFAQRPFATGVGTAFFEMSDDPIPASIDNDPFGLDAYLDAFDARIGQAGERNLRVYLDWRDPSNDGAIPGPVATVTTPVTSDRYQTFIIDQGGDIQRIGHVYRQLEDLTAFALNNVAEIIVDFAVSHHETIQVFGSTVTQGLAASGVAGGQVSSTDNPLTGSFNPLDPANAPLDSTAFTGVGSTNEATDNTDLFFESGRVRFVLVTPPLPPIMLAPDPIEPAPAPAAVAMPVIEEPVFVAAAESVEFANGGYSTQSEDYYQLRQEDREEPVIERISEEFGENLMQPRRLREFVRQEPRIDNGTGYELWLITTKVNENGQTVTIERPVLKFDVFNREPTPATEDLPEVFPELKLIPMPIDDIQEQPGAEAVNLPANDTEPRLGDGPLENGPGVDEADPQQAVPENPLNDDVDGQDSDQTQLQPEDVNAAAAVGTGSRMTQSAVAGLMVTGLLSGRPRHRPGGRLGSVLNRLRHQTQN